MTEDVLVTVSDHIAEIVLNRPHKHNAVTHEMAVRLQEICADVDRDDTVRVILIKGAGERAFSSGSDLKGLAHYQDAWAFRNRVVYEHVVRNLKKPVIAALKGWVLGGGGEIALAADIRVAGRSMKMGFPEVTRGWVGGGGASQMLPRLVGYGQAMRLLLTGEPIGADEAFRLGLVEYLVDDTEVEVTARALCQKIAAFSPVAVQSVKSSVRMALSSTLEAGLRYENEMNTLCFSAGDHMEGIKAFNEGRAANFKR
jgi:enoyl-CoA hydratase/carnithine racemase